MTHQPTSPAAQTTDAAVANAAELDRQLRGFFVERDDEIKCMLLALVAGEHFVMVGPPGTAKSLLTKSFADAVCDTSTDAYFEWLMTKYSVPEELFGPISLMGLERDEYRRVTTGKLPVATVAFLDEVFKANSAILNALLTILNERAFDNPTREACPLEVCIGASNELPEDESLGALFDRFVLRRWVDYVRDRDALGRLLLSSAQPNITARLTRDDIQALRDLRARVDVSGIIDALLDVRDAVARAKITASDRRWRKCLKLAQAAAALDGRDYCVVEDLMVLVDALWDRPEDRPAVMEAIAGVVSPDLLAAMRLYDAAVQQFDKVERTSDAMLRKTAGDAYGNLLSTIGKLEDLEDQGGDGVTELIRKVRSMQLALAGELKKMHAF